MKKTVLTVILIVNIASLINAQDYNTAAGLTGGISIGGTIKHFLNRTSAVEGLLTTRYGGFESTGLFEVHNEAFEVEQLKWYYGGGAHIGFWNGDNVTWGNKGESYTVLGIDGVIGIEYTFTEAPINIGAYWKPALNLIGFTNFWGGYGALCIRYIF